MQHGVQGGMGDLQQELSAHPASLVLDVGAFDGRDAIFYARSGGHRVFSFEPTPRKVEGIQQLLAKEGMSHNVTVFNLALSNYTGTTTFWEREEDGSRGDDQMGWPRAFDGRRPAADQFAILSGKVAGTAPSKLMGNAKPRQVAVDTLDHIVGRGTRVLYAKIDVQGHDFEVVYGAERLLTHHMVRTLAFEVYTEGDVAKEEEYARLVGWLAARGMACYDCARPTWKLAPSDAKAWDARALVRNLSVSIHRKFRETHGSKWTNFVCYVPRKHSATPA